MDLSVIIVSFNTRDRLLRCLRSLPAGAEDLTWEAIVVDNDSHDGSAEAVVEEFPDVTLMRNHENLGFARACNQGIRVSKGKWLLFLNSDAEPRPHALRALVHYLVTHPRAGVLGPRLTQADGKPARSCFRFPSLSRPFLNFKVVRCFAGEHFGLPYPLDQQKIREGGLVDWLSGACLLVRRQAIEQVGFFDPRYFMYFEDADFCRRVWKAGWEVVFWPGAEVVHAGGVSARGHEARLSVELQRSRLIYFSTHHPGVVSGVVRLMALLAAFIRSLRWLASVRLERLQAEARIIKLALSGVNG